MIWLVAILSAGAGAGLWLIARACFAPPRSLAALSAELLAPRCSGPSHSTGIRGSWQRLAQRAISGTSTRQAADMAVVGTTPLQHSLDRLGYTVTFAAIGLVPAGVYSFVGLGSMTAYALVGVLVLALVGWVYPDASLRARARTRRKAWDGAIAAFVDVVGISLAGGAGVDDALMDGARAGSGPEMGILSGALHAAQTRRRTLWSALEDLGTRLDLTQLRELAASMELAGASGSRVRDTLRAKASALRTRQLTDAETEAQKASETMSISPALMAIAAIVLITYPAVARFLE